MMVDAMIIGYKFFRALCALCQLNRKTIMFLMVMLYGCILTDDEHNSFCVYMWQPINISVSVAVLAVELTNWLMGLFFRVKLQLEV